MSDVRLDGGLANEMVELLARELKSVRSQLQAEKQVWSHFVMQSPNNFGTVETLLDREWFCTWGPSVCSWEWKSQGRQHAFAGPLRFTFDQNRRHYAVWGGPYAFSKDIVNDKMKDSLLVHTRNEVTACRSPAATRNSFTRKRGFSCMYIAGA